VPAPSAQPTAAATPSASPTPAESVAQPRATAIPAGSAGAKRHDQPPKSSATNRARQHGLSEENPF
jgi:hypothetical protein